MRTILLIFLIASVSGLKAQTFLSPSPIGNRYTGMFTNNFQTNDSISNKKWSLIRYSAVASQFAFFKGGNATIFSAPIGIQLNRRLNNNLYAFAGVSLSPAYINFNRTFMADDVNKSIQNRAFNSGSLGMYSRAALGLQYINDERTFSISGSISVDRGSYPMIQNNHANTANSKHILSANR